MRLQNKKDVNNFRMKNKAKDKQEHTIPEAREEH
jgi:hypothetical protein